MNLTGGEIAGLIAAIAFAILAISLAVVIFKAGSVVGELNTTIDEVNKTITVLTKNTDHLSSPLPFVYPILFSSTTACEEMPVSSPSKPMRSVVVAFTFAQFSSTPIAAAIFSRIWGI